MSLQSWVRMMSRWINGILLASIFLLSCEHETVRRNDFAVHGIDVSHYQSLIHWESVTAQDFHFAFVKATEGATLYDTMFCQNWSEMNRVGLARGAYHFYRPRTPVEAQVDNYSNWVDLQIGDLPPVLDVEVLDGVNKIQLITGIRTWLFLIELRYNTKPILYTNLKFYNKYLAGHFNDYPLWIARYGWRQPVLACGREWDFWQYGNRGRLEGIDGYVDFNVFKGTLEQLEDLCLSPRPILSETLRDSLNVRR